MKMKLQKFAYDFTSRMILPLDMYLAQNQKHKCQRVNFNKYNKRRVIRITKTNITLVHCILYKIFRCWQEGFLKNKKLLNTSTYNSLKQNTHSYQVSSLFPRVCSELSRFYFIIEVNRNFNSKGA